MKCPKCHNEVLNQRVCPYCGGTIFLEDASLEMENSRFGVSQMTQKAKNIPQEELLTRLDKLEIKISISLVLNISLFFLNILLLLLLL